jgi:hypothetical protein
VEGYIAQSRKSRKKTLPGKTTKSFDLDLAKQRRRVHSPKPKKQEKTLLGKTTKKFDADPAEPAEQRRRVHSPKLKKQEKTLPGKTTKKFDADSAEQRGRLHKGVEKIISILHKNSCLIYKKPV